MHGKRDVSHKTLVITKNHIKRKKLVTIAYGSRNDCTAFLLLRNYECISIGGFIRKLDRTDQYTERTFGVL